MKKTVLLLISLCLFSILGACTQKNKQISPKQSSLSTVQTAPHTTSPAPVSLPEKDAQPSSSVVSEKTITPQLPAKNQADNALTVKQETQQNVQAEPLKDSAQFKNEILISLEGRHLNPLISRPASNKAQTAPWRNEQLKYGVYYSFVKAGTAYIKNQGLVDIDGRAAYLIQTSAFSASVIDAVFKVRDINYSWIDATDFYSSGYSQSLREGNYKRDEWVIFDYQNNTYNGEVKKKEEPRQFSGTVTQQVLDILSALYYVRTHALEPGQDIVFDIINREEQYPLVVKVLGRETIKTAAGKFKCIVVEPQFRGEGIFVSKGKSLKVWLTDDEYKMPVKMKAEVFIGSVSAELLEYKRN